MVSCNDLLSLNIFKDIKLVAGKNGIYKNISWPYICQTLDFSQWVNGGELMFLTGMGMNLSNHKLINLIYECSKKDISGLVILTSSEYIDCISDEVIEVADKENLPLFDMPWNIKLIDVNKEIANYIMESNLNKNKENELLRELLLSYKLDKEKIKNLINYSKFSLDTSAYVASFNLIDKCEEKHISTEYIMNMIKAMIDKNNIRSIIDYYDNCIICIVALDSNSDFNRSKDLLKLVYEKISGYINVSLSIGNIRDNLVEVRDSYYESIKAFKLYRCNNWDLDIIDYNSQGFYKILFEVKDFKKLRIYCDEILGRILDYDKNKSADLLGTLRCYLINNCNLIKTSSELFIHRNTLIYRLNKIRTILDSNLEDPIFKNELMNALMIYNYLKYIENE
ncbi:PucR family transcriptional regulator [Romboutsia weinsteinii]|uniref:PucR family transcriptional regulator n=1 Tax=Romboutsia weinsteinii TaxID=2020949 RepID=A0A371J729_9FIRM|nr:PucR family transcriptional regulator [Romboutsia weinsteinii]RDY28544.1 PucR family transcriptional regulator [Romboutsia weinsteinii]